MDPQSRKRFEMGDYQTFNCPFCEEKGKTPDTGKHFYYYGPERGYHCFRCGAHQNWGYPPARLQGWADQWGGELPDRVMRKYSQEPEYELRVARPVKHWPKVMKYLEERGIESGTAETYKILYVPSSLDHRLRGRIIFPLRDTGGKIIFYSARAFDVDPGRPKYLTPSTPKGSKLYFVGDFRIKTVVIVEGVFDAFAVHAAGYPAICIYGKEVNAQAAVYISSVAEKAVIALDPDAYTKAVDAQLKLSYYVPTRRIELPSDPSQILQDSGASILRWYIDGDQSDLAKKLKGDDSAEEKDRTLRVVPRTGKRAKLEASRAVASQLSKVREMARSQEPVHADDGEHEEPEADGDSGGAGRD